MTGMRDHVLGCTCRRHVDRPWNRSEHWRTDEVAYLETWYGRIPTERIAEKLGRTVTAVTLKAKKLGIRMKDHGLTARGTAEIFGVDQTVVSKVWIRRGLLRARRGYRQGPHQAWVIFEIDVERFIRSWGHYVDVDKMPDSVYRDLAEQHRWYSVPEVCHLTGRDQTALTLSLQMGRYRARKRGPRWYVPAAELPRIAARTHRVGPRGWKTLGQVRAEREARLERRRNLRKGVAA